MVYIIKDAETGNYVSSDSFLKVGKRIYYSSHTGRADGLEYHNSLDGAEVILQKIKNNLMKYNIHKVLEIIYINKESLTKGKIIIEEIFS